MADYRPPSRDRGNRDLQLDPGNRDLVHDGARKDLLKDLGVQDLSRDLGVLDSLRLGVVAAGRARSESGLSTPLVLSAGYALERHRFRALITPAPE